MLESWRELSHVKNFILFSQFCSWRFIIVIISLGPWDALNSLTCLDFTEQAESAEEVWEWWASPRASPLGQGSSLAATGRCHGILGSKSAGVGSLRFESRTLSPLALYSRLLPFSPINQSSLSLSISLSPACTCSGTHTCIPLLTSAQTPLLWEPPTNQPN